MTSNVNAKINVKLNQNGEGRRCWRHCFRFSPHLTTGLWGRAGRVARLRCTSSSKPGHPAVTWHHVTTLSPLYLEAIMTDCKYCSLTQYICCINSHRFTLCLFRKTEKYSSNFKQRITKKICNWLIHETNCLRPTYGSQYFWGDAALYLSSVTMWWFYLASASLSKHAVFTAAAHKSGAVRL